MISSGYYADGRSQYKRARPGGSDYDRLFEAMRASRQILQKFREERKAAIRHYVGRHYADGGAAETVPVNVLARYITLMGRVLVPNAPQVMLSTRQAAKVPAVSAMQEWVNRHLKETYFDDHLRRWVIDAMFCLGVMKVAIGSPADAAAGGYQSPAGLPFAECVDLDDFAFDAGCRDFHKAAWVGHRYRVPLDVAEELDYFANKKELDKAISEESNQTNDEGDERIDGIGGAYNTGWGRRDYRDMVDLWEVYVAAEKKVYTFASDRGGVPCGSSKPLRKQDWIGPACGPYHFLGYGTVPGNPMPKAPVMDFIDLARVINESYRKLMRQLQRQKEVLPATGAKYDDAGRLAKASDGEVYFCDNADTVKPVSYGGPDQKNAAFTAHLADVYNKLAGNLDLLSGAAPQSKTATQDKLLAENASAGVGEMQETTTAGIAGVMAAYCWYWWNHPTAEMEVPREVPGVPDVRITRRLFAAGRAPEDGLARDGRFEDLGCTVDPYSLMYRTPQQRGTFLLQLFEKFAPMAPVLAQSGLHMDVQFLLKKVGEYFNEPDVAGLFTIADPAPAGNSQGGQPGVRPSQTTREYVRRSVGQDTQNQRSADMVNDAMAAGAEEG